eukprot:TRINITY_DN8411_c0_g1_i1.p1 TRINITY_DN8411_c0_g1~~TRINITY_DN8411_c0_g1_i1.p1  ORF type:complete len:247 (-),score=39.05 TRINITY_DN8411_c0_g1_i1:240-935(-)
MALSTQSSLLLLRSSHSQVSSSRRTLCISRAQSTACLSETRPSLTIASRLSSADRRSNEFVRVVAESDSVVIEELDLGGGRGGGGDEGFGGGGGGGGGGDDESFEGDREEGEGESGKNKKKMAMSMSQKLTLGYAALVGVGGVMGYVKSGSQKSLAAGGLSALLLYYVYTQLPVRPTFASTLGLGLSAALLGVMGSRFKKSGKIFPAGVVSVLSFIMAGGYLHGILRGLHA